MDNVFVLQKDYIETIDGYAIKYIISNYAKLFLDEFIFEDDNYINLKKKSLIPVGTLDFVQSFLDSKMKPLEVPEILRDFLNREYHILKGKDITDRFKNGNYFFKDADTLKSWNNALNPYDMTLEDDTNYVVSRRVEFISEYRVFVYNDEIQSIQNYLGDVTVFPNINYIKEIVDSYSNISNKPHAYTLDIGIHNNNTDLIEIHPFVSCGLYGFYDKNIIPMLKEGFSWYKQH